MMKRVVVTGLGALTPIGNTVAEFAEGLKAGTSGAGPITLFDASLFKTRFACEVKNFDPEQWIEKREVRRMDRFSQFAMASSIEAVADAGIDLETIDKSRVGVIWGSGIGGLQSLEKEVGDFATGNGTPRHNPFMIPKMISDIAAGHISIFFGFRGPNYATVSACASSSHALNNAVDAIRLGRADIMVTGGSEASVTATGMGGFNAMKALSENNENASSASRPFDATRDGFILGEGSGTIIVEELEHALARGAKIYAEVVGGAATADAYHITAPHPEGLGVIRVMELALAEAGFTTADIDYINVHGTSTPLGDIAEVKSIKHVFGEDAYRVNISSTKSMTGHLLGAAGAVEAIACIIAITQGFIPPTINHTTPDPEIDPKLNLTLNKVQYREVRAAMSNTFGFGGHNACVVFKKFN
jgi:3-oxoacyl-[acyl-carrier-protein] synthase II